MQLGLYYLCEPIRTLRVQRLGGSEEDKIKKYDRQKVSPFYSSSLLVVSSVTLYLNKVRSFLTAASAKSFRAFITQAEGWEFESQPPQT